MRLCANPTSAIFGNMHVVLSAVVVPSLFAAATAASSFPIAASASLKPHSKRLIAIAPSSPSRLPPNMTVSSCMRCARRHNMVHSRGTDAGVKSLPSRLQYWYMAAAGGAEAFHAAYLVAQEENHTTSQKPNSLCSKASRAQRRVPPTPSPPLATTLQRLLATPLPHPFTFQRSIAHTYTHTHLHTICISALYYKGVHVILHTAHARRDMSGGLRCKG